MIRDTLKDIRNPSHILPALLAILTQKRRRIVRPVVDFEWKNQGLVGSFFRLWEIVFGRKDGIRLESSGMVIDGVLVNKFFTIESYLSYCEFTLRDLIKKSIGDIFQIPFFLKELALVPKIVSSSGEAMATYPYMFAIAIESNDTVYHASANASSSITQSLTIGSGSNEYILGFYEIDVVTTATTLSTSTWNAVSMSQLVKVDPITLQHGNYIFGLVNPTTGTNNMVGTADGTCQFGIRLAYVNLTGAAQTGQPDSTGVNSGTGAATTLTVSITTVADNTAAFIQNACGTTASGGTNETTVIVDAGNGRVLAKSATFPLTPAGLYSMTSNFTTNVGNIFTGTACSIAPVGGAVTTHNLSLLGVGT